MADFCGYDWPGTGRDDGATHHCELQPGHAGGRHACSCGAELTAPERIPEPPHSGVDQGRESGPRPRGLSGGRQQPGELVPDAASSEKGGVGPTAASPAPPPPVRDGGAALPVRRDGEPDLAAAPSSCTCDYAGLAEGRPLVCELHGIDPRTPVTYVCSEPGCDAVFSDPEPDEAWGQYLEHQTGHDMDNDYTLTAEVQN